jgi:two-component system nitrogen regulation sensor histidine kinase NtrY
MHVEDIGRMVDEFSNFARLPTPKMRSEDLSDLCRQVAFLYRNAQPNIKFENKIPSEPIEVVCDGRQFSQALTNLYKNAIESIDVRNTAEEKGKIILSLSIKDDVVLVTLEDNGRGLPTENREQLTDPYFTTRKSGTGLGLAIVRKIMEDHDGGVDLQDGNLGGAIARLRMSRQLIASENAADEIPADRAEIYGV